MSKDFRRLPNKTWNRGRKRIRQLLSSPCGRWGGILAEICVRQANRMKAMLYFKCDHYFIKDAHMIRWRHVRGQYNYAIPDRILKARTALILSSQSFEQWSPSCSWKRKVKAECMIIRIEGTHRSYIREHAAEAARQIEKALYRAG